MDPAEPVFRRLLDTGPLLHNRDSSQDTAPQKKKESKAKRTDPFFRSLPVLADCPRYGAIFLYHGL